MVKRLVVSIVAIAAFLGPVSVKAAAPEFDSICWQKKPCLDARAQMLAGSTYDKVYDTVKKTEIERGFARNQGNCAGGKDDEEWGKCLPLGAAQTEISFGGKTTFRDIGEFLQTNYIYAISLAGIIAVIMVIVGGIQWVISGGNAEAIASAKHRITNALIGLFIAYSSHVILNTINPALVNLRPPQAYMVRPQALMPKFCAQATSTYQFSYTGRDEKDQIVAIPEPSKEVNFDLNFSQVRSEMFNCGKRFYFRNGNQSGGAQTCFGNFCSPGSSCVQNDPQKVKQTNQKYSCREGQLFVNFSISGLLAALKQSIPFVAKLDSSDWLDDDAFAFHAVCRNSDNKLVIGRNQAWKPGSSDTYQDMAAHQKGTLDSYDIIFGNIDQQMSSWSCDSGTLVGFFLTGEVGKNWSWNDAVFTVGYKDGAAVVGLWGGKSKMTVDNFIPLDKLRDQGVSLNVVLDDADLGDIFQNTNSYPH